MDIRSTGLGWTSDGLIVEDSDKKATFISGSKLLMNLIMFHLLTEPGSYKPDPNLGLGLLSLIGKSNTEVNRSELESEINAYFLSLTQFLPYRVRAKVTEIAPHQIEVKISLLGPNLVEDSQLLIDIREGRIVDANTFVEEEEELSESIVEVRKGEEENPYLARLSQT